MSAASFLPAATPQVSAFGVAVDSANAYWTQNLTSGAVETACK